MYVEGKDNETSGWLVQFAGRQRAVVVVNFIPGTNTRAEQIFWLMSANLEFAGNSGVYFAKTWK